jgi:hypothetical protein
MVFTDIGTTPDGEPLYHFTHRTFLEYFTAADLVREAETPEVLFDGLLPHIAQAEWDVVAQLAVQIQSKQTAGAAETLLDRITETAGASPPKERHNLLAFGARCLRFLVPRPATVSEFAGACFDLVFSEDDVDAHPLTAWRSVEAASTTTSGHFYYYLLRAREENLSIIGEELTNRLEVLLRPEESQRQAEKALDALLTLPAAARSSDVTETEDAASTYWVGVRPRRPRRKSERSRRSSTASR